MTLDEWADKYASRLRSDFKAHVDALCTEVDEHNRETVVRFCLMAVRDWAIPREAREARHAENGRLREALQRIIDNPTETSNGYQNLNNWVRWAQRYAADVLASATRNAENKDE